MDKKNKKTVIIEMDKLTKEDIAFAIDLLNMDIESFNKLLDTMAEDEFGYDMLCHMDEVIKKFDDRLNKDIEMTVTAKKHKPTEEEVWLKHGRDSLIKHDLRMFMMNISASEREKYKRAFRELRR